MLQKENNMEIEKIIQITRDLLRNSTEHCDYKRSHVPKGWAHIEIEKFLIDLRNVLDSYEQK